MDCVWIELVGVEVLEWGFEVGVLVVCVQRGAGWVALGGGVP